MPTLIGRRAVLGALAAPFLAGSAEARPPFRLREDPQPLLSPPILDEAGTTRKLDDFAGRVILLNIWATWCPPCLLEMPALAKLQKTLGGPDFEVVTVNIDTRNLDKPKTWLADNRITALPFYADPQAATFQVLRAAHKVEGMPVSLIVDKAGCELGIIQGPADWASADAKALMKAAIGR